MLSAVHIFIFVALSRAMPATVQEQRRDNVKILRQLAAELAVPRCRDTASRDRVKEMARERERESESEREGEEEGEDEGEGDG